MPVDPSALVNEILAGLAKIPPGLFAAILLGGPTAIWLVLRFSNPPDDAPRPPEPAREEFLWVCISCRSLNQELRDSCYRCHRSRADEREPGIPDLGRLPAPASRAEIAPAIGIAVGPGGSSRALQPGLGRDRTRNPLTRRRRGRRSSLPPTRSCSSRSFSIRSSSSLG